MSPFLAQSKNSRSLSTLTLALLGGVSSIVLGAQAANAGTLTGLSTPVTIGTPTATTGTISATASETITWVPNGTISSGNSLVFTLSGGAQFAATPTVSGGNGDVGAGSISGGTYTLPVSTGTLSPTGSATILLSNIQISNFASSITGTTGAINLTYAGVAIASDTASTLAPLVSFTPAVSLSANSSAVATTVDVPSGATRFVSGSTTTPLVSLGSVTLTSNTTVNLAGTAISPSSTGSTLTVSGPLSGISTVVVAPSSSTVSATSIPSGATTGTPSGNSVTVSFPSVASTAYNVYGLATGSTVLDIGSFNVAATVALSSGQSSTMSAVTTATTTYNGTVATVNYAVGGTTGYGSYLYITNRSLAATPVLISVRPSDGSGPFSGTLVSSLPANSSVLVSGPQIDTALGTSLFTTAGQRSNLRVLVGTTSAAVTGLLVNPSGDVNDIGLSFSGSN